MLALASPPSIADPATADPVEPARVDLTPMHDRFVSAISTDEALHLRSADPWRQFWRRFDGPAPPPVDFEKYDVLVYLMATKPTGGYFVRIVEVDGSMTGTEVTVLLCNPPPDSPQIAVLTAPFDALQVPKLRAPVRWKTRSGETGVPPCVLTRSHPGRRVPVVRSTGF